MAWGYNRCVLTKVPGGYPISNIDIEMVRTDTMAIVQVIQTNKAGVAQFTTVAPTGVFFRPRIIGDNWDLQITDTGAGEGWPTYDYIVDDDWAETGLAEGTVINTYTGTKIYSTVQGAVDAWAASLTDKSIFICPGHYDEDVVIQTTAERGIQRISIEGAAGGTAFIDGSITVDGAWFYNSSLKEERSASVIRNLKVSYRAVGSAGDLIFGIASTTNSIAGLCFENCNFEGTFKSVYPDVSYGTIIQNCSFKGCTFHHVNDGGRVIKLSEVHFESCTIEDEFEMYANSVTITSELGTGASDPPCTFVDCEFGNGVRVADIRSAIFTGCSFRQHTGTIDYTVWISGGDGSFYGPTINAAIFSSCHFFYNASGATNNFSYFLLGNEQSGGFMTWENFIVTDCIFDVPNSLPGSVLMYIVYVKGNLDQAIPKIVFAHNALIEDSDGGRLEDLRAGCYTVSGTFRDSVFGPCEPPNFDVELGSGSVNNLYIGTGVVTGPAGGVTVIGEQGVLYDAGGLLVGWRDFICRFNNAVLSVAPGTLALTDDATNYIQVSSGGVVSANTTAYSAGYIPLGRVVTVAGDITALTQEAATLDLDSGATGPAGPPGNALDYCEAQLDIVNDSTEQDLYSFTIPGASFTLEGSVRLTLLADYFNNSAASRTFTLKIKYGATTIYQDVSISTAVSASRRPILIQFTLANQGATNSQVLGGSILFGTAGGATAGIGDLATDEIQATTPLFGTSAEDSTADKVLAITIQHSAAHASLSMRRQYAVLELPGGGGVITPSVEDWSGISNASEDRTADMNATTIDELSDIVGTLISDLRAIGLLQ